MLCGRQSIARRIFAIVSPCVHHHAYMVPHHEASYCSSLGRLGFLFKWDLIFRCLKTQSFSRHRTLSAFSYRSPSSTLSFPPSLAPTLLRTMPPPLASSASLLLPSPATTSPVVTESGKQLAWQAASYLVGVLGNSIRYPEPLRHHVAPSLVNSPYLLPLYQQSSSPSSVAPFCLFGKIIGPRSSCDICK